MKQKVSVAHFMVLAESFFHFARSFVLFYYFLIRILDEMESLLYTYTYLYAGLAGFRFVY